MAIALAALLGLVLGCFLNLIIQRLPTTRPLFRRPHCVRCGQGLSWEDVPLVGFLVQRGRCRHCGQPIPQFFPLVELLTALVLAALVWRYGVTWRAGLYAFFSLALIVTLFLDWLRHEIYYIILLPGTVIALLSSLFPARGLGFTDSLTQGIESCLR